MTKMTKVLYEPNQLQRVRNVFVGNDVVIRDFVNLSDCTIGDSTRIGPFVEIEPNVTVGSRCKISSHSLICEDVTIEDEVFIGHGVVFCDDPLETAKNSNLIAARVKKGASIGSGAVISARVVIGAGAIVGAGAVVKDDVPDNAIVAGNPARILRFISDENRVDF